MYSHILVPVDLDEASSWGKAVQTARKLAENFAARLTLCTVVPDNAAMLKAGWSPPSYDALLEKAAARLILLKNELGLDEAQTEVGMGSVANGVLALAERGDVDLIVLSAHRPEMQDWLLGTNTSRIVRHAKCSVFVVRD
ncbi:universal stress protein [Aurantiacibacter sp. MUD11]|uniref:universal stress protein n=1 Tax=Aurantiacibacter sp. MUD11 TaxID=3003265 RepID=UPI0022AA6733|nr:universal stress protein [Aurantiacibacter sp. MUD11]WAT16878.1 universal stress protein [Aurantiacibacter sp. MUD11]